MYARLPGTSGEIRRRRPISSRLCRAVDGDERVFVIVGGGPAGLSAVQTLREEGYTGHIRLISKEDHLPYVCARHVGITHRASEWSLYVCMHVGTTAPYSIATLGRPKKWKTSSERPPCARRSSTRNMMSLRSWQQTRVSQQRSSALILRASLQLSRCWVRGRVPGHGFTDHQHVQWRLHPLRQVVVRHRW